MDPALAAEKQGSMHELAPVSAAIRPVLVCRWTEAVRSVFTLVRVLPAA